MVVVVVVFHHSSSDCQQCLTVTSGLLVPTSSIKTKSSALRHGLKPITDLTVTNKIHKATRIYQSSLKQEIAGNLWQKST